MPEHKPSTPVELAEHRRSIDRPVEVHVVGDFDHDPPLGLKTARHVANHLTDEGGTVRDPGEDLEDGDVAWVRIDEPPTVSYEERMQLEKLSHMARLLELAGIVVFTPEVGRRYDTHLDARVWATSGDVDRVHRLEFNPYDKETIAVELDGVGW